MCAKDILRSLALPFVFVLLCLGLSFMAPYFLTPQNILNALVASATLGVLSVGAALVIGARGIDLSVGAIMAFSASLCTLFIHIDGVNSTFLILLCLVSGIGVGLVNGLFAAFTAFPPFIITLAMMSVVRGLAFIIMDGRPLYGLPSGLIFLGQGSFAGIPLPILIFILIAVGGHIILRYTAFGLHLCAYGDNPSAVKTSGVNVTRLKLTLYGLSGFTGAVAGLIFMGRLNAIDPSAGLTYELTAITAAIMGGAKLSGGRTSVMGAVTGTLIISFLQNGLNLMAIPSFYQYIATGIMLLLAVMSQPKERL